jgi:drug/metabolite transporter (DMT)-like permease
MQDRTKEIYMYILGAIVVFSIIAFAACLIFFPIPDQNKDMVNIALGAFIGAFVTVVGYYYGSSKGSADKTQIMKQTSETEAAKVG